LFQSSKVVDAFGALRQGEVPSDVDFDSVYSYPVQRLSEQHWTPVAVAFVAAKLLVRDKESRVLDVGSGAGKFCHVGATVTPARFYGIDQSNFLVEEAQSICQLKGITNAEFTLGNALDLDWRQFDAVYLFNPFFENIGPSSRLDRAAELDSKIFMESVATVENKLREMPAGTRVVTYYGFGGKMPVGYKPYFKSPYRGDYLRAWVKIAAEEK